MAEEYIAIKKYMGGFGMKYNEWKEFSGESFYSGQAGALESSQPFHHFSAHFALGCHKSIGL